MASSPEQETKKKKEGRSKRKRLRKPLFQRLGAQQRLANKREKDRSRRVSEALSKLKQAIWKSGTPNVSTFQTLRMAIAYISLLASVVDTGSLPDEDMTDWIDIAAMGLLKRLLGMESEPVTPLPNTDTDSDSGLSEHEEDDVVSYGGQTGIGTLTTGTQRQSPVGTRHPRSVAMDLSVNMESSDVTFGLNECHRPKELRSPSRALHRSPALQFDMPPPATPGPSLLDGVTSCDCLFPGIPLESPVPLTSVPESISNDPLQLPQYLQNVVDDAAPHPFPGAASDVFSLPTLPPQMPSEPQFSDTSFPSFPPELYSPFSGAIMPLSLCSAADTAESALTHGLVPQDVRTSEDDAISVDHT